jgi:hypothetical protein
MPKISISKEMYTRITEFKCVVEAVIKEEINSDYCLELILDQGINSMLADLLGSLDQNTLLKSFQQIGSKYPVQVYQYVAETLKEGAALKEELEKIKQKMVGFVKKI